jgi:hypothetical protein
MSATDMAGQRNFSGTSQTVTIPAISSTVFATGMTSVINNQGSGNLSITTTPTLNGIASASQIDIDGWMSCVSNNTSLDCIGFPGFGTITTNALGKFNDSTGAMTASSLVDNGTVVLSSEPLGVTTAEGMFYAVPNDASTGTTVNKLAKLTSAGKAIIGSTTDTAGILGIVISTTATTGNAEIVYAGQAVCAFDGTATDGDFVIPSTSAAGKCHDSGTASPRPERPAHGCSGYRPSPDRRQRRGELHCCRGPRLHQCRRLRLLCLRQRPCLRGKFVLLGRYRRDAVESHDHLR